MFMRIRSCSISDGGEDGGGSSSTQQAEEYSCRRSGDVHCSLSPHYPHYSSSMLHRWVVVAVGPHDTRRVPEVQEGDAPQVTRQAHLAVVAVEPLMEGRGGGRGRRHTNVLIHTRRSRACVHMHAYIHVWMWICAWIDHSTAAEQTARVGASPQPGAPWAGTPCPSHRFVEAHLGCPCPAQPAPPRPYGRGSLRNLTQSVLSKPSNSLCVHIGLRDNKVAQEAVTVAVRGNWHENKAGEAHHAPAHLFAIIFPSGSHVEPYLRTSPHAPARTGVRPPRYPRCFLAAREEVETSGRS